jgi:hypothetical protein
VLFDIIAKHISGLIPANVKERPTTNEITPYTDVKCIRSFATIRAELSGINVSKRLRAWAYCACILQSFARPEQNTLRFAHNIYSLYDPQSIAEHSQLVVDMRNLIKRGMDSTGKVKSA